MDLNDYSTVHVEREGDVAVLVLHNPPVNGMSLGLRQALATALLEAQAEPSVIGVVVIGSGGVFCGGADLKQLGTPAYWTYPRTIELAALIDGMSKPVVAAIGRMALGGGLELALGCHHRIAAAGARLALPEIKLALIPGGGATLRLPGLIGLERALVMMLGGEALTAEQALEWGLADAVCEPADLRLSAVARARALAASGVPLRRAKDLAVDLNSAVPLLAGAKARASASPGRESAMLAIIDCLEGAFFVSHDEGFKRAGDWTAQRIRSSESRALRHLFFAEREALRWVDQDRSVDPPRSVWLNAVTGSSAANVTDAVAFIAEALTRSAYVVAHSGHASGPSPVGLHLAIDWLLKDGPGHDDASAVHERLEALCADEGSAGTPLIVMADPARVIDPDGLCAGRPVVIIRLPQGKVVEMTAVGPGGAAYGAWLGRVLRKAGYLPIAVRGAGASVASALRQREMTPVDQGRVERPGDIDLIAVHGCGFPDFRGGPLYQVSEAVMPPST
jgi:enoyl-CoA hydratase/carnithine racemase